MAETPKTPPPQPPRRAERDSRPRDRARTAPDAKAEKAIIFTDWASI